MEVIIHSKTQEGYLWRKKTAQDILLDEIEKETIKHLLEDSTPEEVSETLGISKNNIQIIN